MNNRQRKKWLKKHGEYVNPRECWNLDCTFADFALPRLKYYKKHTLGYPGREGAETPEKWDKVLDEMIIAFQYITEYDDWWLDDPKYDYTDGLIFSSDPDPINPERMIAHIEEEDWVNEIRKVHKDEEKRRQQIIEDGLTLFAKWFQYLGW